MTNLAVVAARSDDDPQSSSGLSLMHHLRLPALILAGILVLARAGNAVAQQSTSATYDDWVVRCVTQAGTPPQKACDMEQMTQVQGKNTPLSRVVVPRSSKGLPVRLIIQLPVNVWLPTGVKIQMHEKDAGLAGIFEYCAPAGCFAAADISDDLLKSFRSHTGAGRILFKNAARQDIAIPLSFKGFGPAFDALSKN